MIFDNRDKIVSVRKRRLYLTIATCLIIVLIMLLDFFKKPFLGMQNYVLAIFFGVIYLIAGLYFLYKRENYIYFSNEQNKFTFRYFSLSIFNSKKRMAIEIPKKDFVKYELLKGPLGLSEEIALFQKTGNKVFRYSPFSLSGITKDQRTDILDQLDLYTRQNK